MNLINGCRRSVFRVVAVAAMSCAIVGSAVATKLNTDVSDIWWNPAQDGWGMQLVNTGTFVFATVFTYGADGKPIWITGELTAGASSTFSGSTYINTGPYFGGTWNNGAVTQREVGTMTFALASVTTGLLTYTVDGVTVSTPVQRQPLTRDGYGGTYLGAVTYTISGCADTANNVTASTSGQVTIVQDDTLAYLTLPIDGGGTCAVNGTLSQFGRMGQIGGTFSCTNGESGNGLMFQMNNQPFMLMARVALQNPETGCSMSGEVVGLIPR
jgi:hypothetical protein